MADHESLRLVNDELMSGQEALRQHLLAAEAAAAAMALTRSEASHDDGDSSLPRSERSEGSDIAARPSTGGGDGEVAGTHIHEGVGDGEVAGTHILEGVGDARSARLEEAEQRALLAEESQSKLQKQVGIYRICVQGP